MRFSKSEEADDNYVASIVKLGEIKPHPDADRLEITKVFGNDIITRKGQYEKGAEVVYFPIESSINAEFLSWANLFDKPELNKDQTTTGFFSAKGRRVKAVKLRGIPSQGFVYPMDQFRQFLIEKFPDDSNVVETVPDFDTINDFLLLEKYVSNGGPQVAVKRVPTKFEKVVGKFPRPIRKPILSFYNRRFHKKPSKILDDVVDGYFNFHYKTEHLGKNSHLVEPKDDITVTSKFHGCVKHDTPVETEEYGILPISKIVDERLVCKVRGYDTESGEIKWVNVDDYYFKPDDGEWYEIELENGEKITITGNNPVWLPDLSCYRKVDELTEGDSLLVESFR